MGKQTRPTRTNGAPPPRQGLQRRTRTYRFAQGGAPTSDIPGNYLFNPGANIDLVRLQFEKGGPTVFRAFPALNPDDERNSVVGQTPTGDFDPYRLSPTPYDYTDWLRSYPCAVFAGKDTQFTAILFDKAEANAGTYDKRTNPYIVLYKAIKNAVDKGTAPTGAWKPIVESERAELSAPKELAFMQGLLYEHNDEIYIGPGKAPKGGIEQDRPQILQLTPSASKELLKKLEKQREGWEGSIDDYLQMFEYGDPVDINAGRFLTFLNPQEVKKRGKQVAAEVDVDLDDWDTSGRSGSRAPEPGGERGFKGYEVEITQTYHPGGNPRGVGPSLAKRADFVRKRILWWDDIIRISTHDELCVYIARSFRSLRKMVEFGWRDHPEFFTDEVRGILAMRTQGPGAEIPSDADDEFVDADDWSGMPADEEETAPPPPTARSQALPDDALDGFDDAESDEFVDDQEAAEEADTLGDEIAAYDDTAEGAEDDAFDEFDAASAEAEDVEDLDELIETDEAAAEAVAVVEDNDEAAREAALRAASRRSGARPPVRTAPAGATATPRAAAAPPAAAKPAAATAGRQATPSARPAATAAATRPAVKQPPKK